MDHPVLVPGSPYHVRWLCHTDGRCHGREFYDSVPECKAALLAQARQISVNGKVSKQPENGHWLKGEFADVYEMKPGNFRFMVFRHGNDFYITNGAQKKTERKQRADWQFAVEARKTFFANSGLRRHK
jgi:hypothetical protein